MHGHCYGRELKVKWPTIGIIRGHWRIISQFLNYCRAFSLIMPNVITHLIAWDGLPTRWIALKTSIQTKCIYVFHKSPTQAHSLLAKCFITINNFHRQQWNGFFLMNILSLQTTFFHMHFWAIFYGFICHWE